jgi:hypothetical protein
MLVSSTRRRRMTSFNLKGMMATRLPPFWRHYSQRPTAPGQLTMSLTHAELSHVRARHRLPGGVLGVHAANVMAADMTGRLWEIADVVKALEDREARQLKRPPQDLRPLGR